MLMENPQLINTCGNVVHIAAIAQCRGIHRPRSDFNVLEEVDAVSGAAFAIRRSAFETLGGFDPDFFLYVEDTDLSIRARIAGWKCIYQPASVVYHDYHLKFGPHKIFHQERNRYLTILKNFSWATILALSPAYLLAEIMTWGFCMITLDAGNLRNKIEAYAWILTRWGTIRAKHRAVQSLRRVRDREVILRCSSAINFRQITRFPLAQLSEAVFNTAFAILKRIALVFVW
jgi:GT2 family glycosyltransferase